MGFGMLVWVLLLAIVIWGVSRGVPTLRSRTEASSADRETPLQILERRYAGGEISTEEYEERKQRLEGRAR